METVSALQAKMGENIGLALDNRVDVETLQEKTDLLERNSEAFHKTAKKVLCPIWPAACCNAVP